MRKLLTAIAVLINIAAIAQVGIGTTTPNSKAALDITATDKGFLIPRMDSVSRVAITSPPDGLMVFQTDGRKGFWYAVGGAWLYIPDKTGSGDNLGNHTATQTVNLQNQLLVGANTLNGTPGTTGIRINGAGQVGIGTDNPAQLLQLGSTTRPQPTFLRMGAGYAYAQREWEMGVTLNPSNPSDITGENYDFAIRDVTGNATRLLIDYATGNVGIGKDPSMKLDVAGGVKADLVVSEQVNGTTFTGSSFTGTTFTAGTVTSGTFSYPTAKNRVLSLPCDAFASTNPSSYQISLPLIPSTRVGDVTTQWLRLINGTTGNYGYVSAPVNLPDGVTVTQLQLTASDGTQTSVSAMATLVGLKNNDPTSNIIPLELQTVTTSPGSGYQTVSSPSVSHIVNNSLYNYKVIVQLDANSGDTRLGSVKILYTVNSPD